MDVNGRGLLKKLYHIFLERLRKSAESSVRLTRKPTDNSGGYLSKMCRYYATRSAVPHSVCDRNRFKTNSAFREQYFRAA